MHDQYNKNFDDPQSNVSINKLINLLKILDAIWGIKKTKHQKVLRQRHKVLKLRKKLAIRAKLLIKRRKKQQRLQKVAAWQQFVDHQNSDQQDLLKKTNYNKIISNKLQPSI